MARWVNIKGATGGTLAGSAEYDEDKTRMQFFQDEKPFLEQAKLDREQITKDNKLGAKKFATIPDLVAIEINEKYGIDIHAPETMADRDKMTRFKHIIKWHYPYLLSY